MVVTTIRPTKTTLKKAIDDICNGDKTDDEIHVITHICSRENAHKEFDTLHFLMQLASDFLINI